MTASDTSGPFAIFQHALNQGRFLIQRSRSTGDYVFPPRVAAPGSGTDDLEWQEVSGLGHIYALTIIGRRAERGGDYNIALVELDEGPRLMSRVVGVDPSELRIGQRVQACVGVPDFGPLKDGNQAVVMFRPLIPTVTTS
ncbi:MULTISPECIES: OB-fold domain-containing protein [unclassified Chelatococcus]|uniref:Zn-ribbon domain-containing OB-fold protein n=1 Tax=unclassified Chelatococcus TaxID=2638111 RepID=UPI001BCB350A|nr:MULTISPECIES: OB-fold domain-containing protein [unclassified Chelatococcus]MBS7698553.1 OB-fold domain-containing protein [Chelatococcus sp. YT9]MBX3554796.1 OB-fold domain-containing protein [Chelatococcus sp.]